MCTSHSVSRRFGSGTVVKHTVFPKYTSYYDSDGMPKFCDVAFTNWKHRKPKHKGDKYYIRIGATTWM